MNVPSPFRRFVFTILIGTVSVVFSGCGHNIPVSGKVLFEDGTPLETGIVVFQSETHIGKGKITSAGRYTVGSVKPGDGLPPGSYKAYIINAGQVRPGFVPEPESDDSGVVSLIDPVFSSMETTPLQLDVTKKSFYEIKVKPYVSSSRK